MEPQSSSRSQGTLYSETRQPLHSLRPSSLPSAPEAFTSTQAGSVKAWEVSCASSTHLLTPSSPPRRAVWSDLPLVSSVPLLPLIPGSSLTLSPPRYSHHAEGRSYTSTKHTLFLFLSLPLSLQTAALPFEGGSWKHWHPPGAGERCRVLGPTQPPAPESACY